MLPVHMACLSGYSDCVEVLVPRGEGGVGGSGIGGSREGALGTVVMGINLPTLLLNQNSYIIDRESFFLSI